MIDESFYVMFNAHHDPLEFTLPVKKWGTKWAVLLNTAEDLEHMTEEGQLVEIEAGGKISVQAWSLVLLRRTVL